MKFSKPAPVRGQRFDPAYTIDELAIKLGLTETQVRRQFTGQLRTADCPPPVSLPGVTTGRHKYRLKASLAYLRRKGVIPEPNNHKQEEHQHVQ